MAPADGAIRLEDGLREFPRLLWSVELCVQAHQFADKFFSKTNIMHPEAARGKPAEALRLGTLSLLSEQSVNQHNALVTLVFNSLILAPENVGS